jgi:hypothetical protein
MLNTYLSSSLSPSLPPPPSDSTHYVDPNGGSRHDAMEVVCRKMEKYDGWFTCIKPAQDTFVSCRSMLHTQLAIVIHPSIYVGVAKFVYTECIKDLSTHFLADFAIDA